jgi:precorrin-6Y C5,15-methyltransferase (decarboxylating)
MAEAARKDPWLTLVGIGEDGLDGLSPAAVRAIQGAEIVVGGERHLALAAALIRGEAVSWPKPFDGAVPLLLGLRGRRVAVLATGDPTWFGIGATLFPRIAPSEMRCLPGASAFTMAAVRLGWALQDVATLSLHGRVLSGLDAHLAHGARLLVLSWDGTTPVRVAERLVATGFGNSTVTVLEAMGGPSERVRAARADAFDLVEIAPLNTLAITLVADSIPPVLPLVPGIDDDLFESDGQLTKRDIRALTLSALAPRPHEHLWDVGAGSGSISIEWLLRHPTLSASAIERRPGRAARVAANARTLGVGRLTVIEGSAPAAFAGLSAPNAIFLGGGITTPGLVADAVTALKPGGRLVANVVTLEGEAALLAAMARYGGEATRISLSRSDPVGTMTGWRPAMPVTQWRLVKS